ncbi:MAG TPA: potassium-transporting ATPase subunit KdpC [Pirellulaceae bacterium]|nr:potassium-transporting ATPase subunit KdpC [Pirellulaceae bacterium]
MFQDLLRQLRPALVIFVLLSIITGIVYPLSVTGISAALFPAAAGGSLIEKEGMIVGSRLIGQPFEDEKYFWGRPSATTPAYNGGASSGSNLGPTNPALLEVVKQRLRRQRATAADPGAPVPVDLVTASGSGLDPHISPAAAYYQVNRVAAARGIPVELVRNLVTGHIELRTLGVLGEPRVNVLLLNLALDELR